MIKKDVLAETIKCLEHLMFNIGEETTEYHWREFADLSKELVDTFPEYELDKVINSYYNNLKLNNNGEVISTY